MACGEGKTDEEIKRLRTEAVKLNSSIVEERGDGRWALPTFWEMEEKIRALDIKDDDVWIVSHPKSGTTWMQEMAWLLTHNSDFEGAKTLLKYRSPGIESTWTKRFFKMPGMSLDNFEKLASMSGGRRVLKTHLQWDMLPAKLQDPNTTAKIIYVARNPMDVCVSYYYFHMLYGNFEGKAVTLDSFCYNFMYGKHMFGPYWRHVKKFWNLRNNSNILFVKYEDMKKDLAKVICQVATFLEVPLPNGELMKKLLEHLSFGSMKKNPALNRKQGEDKLNAESIPSGNGDFIRKGIVGGWKDKMSAELEKEFKEWIENNSKDTDLRFEYEFIMKKI